MFRIKYVYMLAQVNKMGSGCWKGSECEIKYCFTIAKSFRIIIGKVMIKDYYIICIFGT